MTNHPGMGVMLGMLGGNEETVNAVKSSLNKVIKKVWLDAENNDLKFEFEDGTKLKLWDGGQSCCESRYMVTADDLTEYSEAKLLNIELKDAPNAPDEYGDHEIQFLDVTTDKGVFQMANHNEHNGYYGGFWIQASLNN
jgi:hypothetical protein